MQQDFAWIGKQLVVLARLHLQSATSIAKKLLLTLLANATVRVSSVLQQDEWVPIGFFPGGANTQRLMKVNN